MVAQPSTKGCNSGSNSPLCLRLSNSSSCSQQYAVSYPWLLPETNGRRGLRSIPTERELMQTGSVTFCCNFSLVGKFNFLLLRYSSTSSADCSGELWSWSVHSAHSCKEHLHQKMMTSTESSDAGRVNVRTHKQYYGAFCVLLRTDAGRSELLPSETGQP